MRRTHASRRPTTLALALALAACGGDATAPPSTGAPTTATVSMFPQAFSPPSLILAQHGTVTFDFPPSIDHNVIFPKLPNGQPAVPGSPADIPTSSANRNRQITRRFDVVGTFPFDCTVHPGMSGEIVVR